MNPKQIANEAAEAYTRQEYPGLCTGLSDDTADFLEIRDQLAALILTAAAKMVRESGAVEALDSFPSAMAPIGSDNGWVIYKNWEKHCDACNTALAKLRAITEGKA